MEDEQEHFVYDNARLLVKVLAPPECESTRGGNSIPDGIPRRR